MQAIQVKYLGPTNTKGVLVKAICDAGSITRGRDYALNIDADAMQVATELANSLNWLAPYPESGMVRYALKQGQLPNGDYCHVLVAK